MSFRVPLVSTINVTGRFLTAVLLTILFLCGFGTSLHAQPAHGAAIAKSCNTPIRSCDDDSGCDDGNACTTGSCDNSLAGTTSCQVRVTHNDDYEDRIQVDSAYDIVQSAIGNVRVPAAGNLPILSVSGNTDCVPGPFVPCVLGHDSGVGPGEVTFLSEGYNPTAADPIPLLTQAFVSFTDQCDGLPTPDCNGTPGNLLSVSAAIALFSGCESAPIECDDNDVCTTDTCDPFFGCANTPGALLCDDGDTCTDDLCDPMDGCIFVGNGSCNETPTGTNVAVDPIVVDENNHAVPGAPEVSVTFADVQTAGETTVVAVEYEEEGSPPPPSGFKIGGLAGGLVIYDIETTADLAPGSTFEICFDYSSLTITGDPADLALIHEEDGVWVDITSSNDTVNMVLCGITDSFSFFALVESVVIFEVSDPVAPVDTEVVLGVDVGSTPVADAVYWSWGDGTDSVSPVTSGNSEVTAGHVYSSPGVYAVTAEFWLTSGSTPVQTGSAEYRFVVVFYSSSGFVTGGGWIESPEGAYTPDPTLTGKAHFGFVSKYSKGAHAPTGTTEFQFHAGNLNFHSSSYDWLVIAGARAQYKGSGTVNGWGNFGFMLKAVDAEHTASTEVDLFRVKIWDKDNGDQVIYDNNLGSPEDSDPSTAIAGGSIKIHKTKK